MSGVVDLVPGLTTALEGVAGLRPLGMRRILIGRSALDRLPVEVKLTAAAGPVVIVEDATPMVRGGDDLKQYTEQLVSSVARVRRVVLGPPSGGLHADQQSLTQAAASIEGAGCVVTVGSGTVTDIGKHASAVTGVPMIAVQTAASVNGYADDMAVILRDGVKRTVPAAWPDALIVDTEVLRDAPEQLTRSGYAEMMAMFTAPADWRLASRVGTDTGYERAVVDLFRPRGEELLAASGAVAAGDGRALELLATTLTTSGVAMGVAGRTAPLSGTEHLISHLIDMSAPAAGLPTGLHGAQVGVAAVVAATLWEWLLERIDPAVLRSGFRQPDEVSARREVERAFRWLDPTGAAAAECWSDYAPKLAAWSRLDGDRLAVAWERLAVENKEIFADPKLMVAALTAAGAPTRFSELEPPVEPDRARWAVGSSHLMRERFTVADLAWFTGNWTAHDVDEVLDRAAEIGGGL